MKYHGKLYGKIGRRYIPLEQDTEYVTELENQIEKMKNCANCKFGYLGEADMFENCRNCTMMYCICQKTKKEMDWDEKCDSWEL